MKDLLIVEVKPSDKDEVSEILEYCNDGGCISLIPLLSSPKKIMKKTSLSSISWFIIY